MKPMTFEDPADKKKISPIIAGFKTFCVGSVNVTYERYIFNRRIQESGERIETFLDELRHLATPCDFGDMEDSMLRD